MLKKVLVANRGEIAVRIIRACKELNIKTVAIYSEADKDALHTKLADEAVCVGPAPSAKSYLNIQNILEAACTTNCDSVHPGFGFLSENASFAKMCEESNLKFIGPSYKVIDMMGNKSHSKELMKNAKVPVVPGSEGCIENPRHVEMRVLADEHGNVVHLGERDCSVQRRNQKVLEESPSMVLNEELRAKMGKAATRAVKASGYTNAGTIEFLVDKDKNFYFMEMNTRIQVEHPVTEMVTGIDIVKEQIKIASGEKLEFEQKDITFRGHAIECRINAENPDKNFRPCPGKITELNLPGGNGVRVDTAVYTGYTIPPVYDSMIAKLIVHAENRNAAIAKMKRALEECVIEGIDTNIDFLFRILSNEHFINNDYDTSFIEKFM